MRKTKIICTIGPASSSEDILKELMLSGMNVARLNFSHGTHAEHLKVVNRIKRLREELGLAVALLMDTKGPEIRTHKFENDGIELVTGAEVRIVQEDVLGNTERFSITYKEISKDLSEGSRILLDDGLISLKVKSFDAGDLICEVINGGPLSNNKSIHLPGVSLNLPSITTQDEKDIKFAVENEFDFIAASFVRKPSDIVEIKRVLNKENCKSIDIIAKIENQEGVNNFRKIIEVSDGVMVARGDLGVEIPEYEVPTIQKQLIKIAYSNGKVSITATEMLDSMIRNPRPTRAEVSDVANAVLDGTSAIMLSGETAMGKYPVQSLCTMANIALHTEQKYDYWDAFKKIETNVSINVADAVSHACCSAAYELDAQAIVAITHSGRTARLVSRFRPGCLILAPTVSASGVYRLALSWGVIPYLIDELTSTDDLFAVSEELAKTKGHAKDGDTIVISCGTPVGMSGTTNTMKVATVGSAFTRGVGINPSNDKSDKISGDVLNLGLYSDQDLEKLINDPEGYGPEKATILVCKNIDLELLPLIRQSRAVVVENSDSEGHAVAVCQALQIPLVYGAENATKLLKNGQVVVLDIKSGLIS